MKKIIYTLLVILLAFVPLCAGGNKENAPLKIGIPDDATNGARTIKLLEKAGLIEVDPSVGFNPELKDVTKYVYNIEIVPTAANTLTVVLPDYGAATINGTYATSYGLVPSKDAVLIESQSEGEDNPYVNVVVARSNDKDNPLYKKIVDAIPSELVAKYLLGKYKEAYFPAFKYEDKGEYTPESAVEFVDSYKSNKSGKTVIKIGVCGSSNSYWNAIQYNLDQNGAGIYIQLVEFDAYNLPNEALSSGDIDLNSFQHKAYLKKECDAQGYNLFSIADTLIAPLSLYTTKAKSVEELQNLAGKKN